MTDEEEFFDLVGSEVDTVCVIQGAYVPLWAINEYLPDVVYPKIGDDHEGGRIISLEGDVFLMSDGTMEMGFEVRRDNDFGDERYWIDVSVDDLDTISKLIDLFNQNDDEVEAPTVTVICGGIEIYG